MLQFLLFLLIVVPMALPLLLGARRLVGRGDSFARVPGPAWLIWRVGLLLLGLFTYWVLLSGSRFYTDYLWWSEDIRQRAAFLTLLWTRWGWGMAFAASAVFFVGVNVWFARRRTAGEVADGPARVLARVLALVALAMAFRHGMVFGQGHWREILLWKHQIPFAVTEPIFNRDVGFYVFSYPLLEQVTRWALGLIGLTLLWLVLIYMFRAAGRLGLRPGGRQGSYTLFIREQGDPAVWNRLLTHASLLGFLLLVGFMVQTRLAMWGLMYSTHGVVYGPGYTDLHVMLPALKLMFWALALGSVLLLVAVVARSLRVTIKALQAGVALVALVWFLGLVLVPTIVQRYRVSPNETTLEIPYIRHNMMFTRLGFALTDDRVEHRDFPPVAPLDRSTLTADSVTLANVRLWDWRALESTYDQNQSFRQYYDFYDVDIDRYTVGGGIRQVMLSLRELNQRTFTADAATWVNMRLIYTHGYGLCMNPTNEFTTEGLPNYWTRDIPPAVTDSSLKVTQPEVYFGELTTNHVYVGAAQKEFDYPRGDENVYASYSGRGGVPLGTGLRRLALALNYDGLRQLTSADLASQSRILFRRDVIRRLRTAAPFLEFDHDPYAVVAEGRLYILVDAYTTSDHFPYSEMSNGINYIRNSVKAAVDCYDGTVSFYVFDETDPIIQTWQRVFPALLKPASEMSAALRLHIRYPEDFLSIQADVYSTYHMTDPRVFYNKEDRWAIPSEPGPDGRLHEMLPYYAVMKLPGEPGEEEFVQLLPFTPFSVSQPKNNMVGWMAGRCDGEAYGRLLVYRFPKQSLVYGPMQIQARIDQDASISKDLTLWNQQGSSVIRGNLIVLPLQNSLIYTEPIFLQATHSRMPELKRVVVASQERLGYGENFAEALADLLQGPLPPGLYAAITGYPATGLGEAAAFDTLGVAMARGFPQERGVAGAPLEVAEWQRAREHYLRYLELAGAGRLAEAGQELEKLGQALGIAREGRGGGEQRSR
jgi:hypothetical protein